MSERPTIEDFKQRMKYRIDKLEEEINAHAEASEATPHIEELRDDLATLRREYEAAKFKEENDEFYRERNRLNDQYDDIYTRFIDERLEERRRPRFRVEVEPRGRRAPVDPEVERAGREQRVEPLAVPEHRRRPDPARGPEGAHAAETGGGDRRAAAVLAPG